MFRDYITYAGNGTSVWRFIASVILIFLTWILATGLILLPFLGYLVFKTGDPLAVDRLFQSLLAGQEQNWLGQIFVFLMFGSVAALWFSGWLAQMIMRLPFGSLLSFIDRFRWQRLFHAAAVAILVFLPFLALNIGLEWERYSFSPNWKNFALSLVLMLPLVLAQASGEELVFRGWFVQQLSRVSVNPVLLWFFPGLIFTALHAANPEVVTAGPWVLAFFMIFSALMFWAVRRDGGLEVAFALHWINNIFVLPVRPAEVEGSGALSGFSLLFYDGSVAANYLDLGIQLIIQSLMIILILVLLFAKPSPLRLDR